MNIKARIKQWLGELLSERIVDLTARYNATLKAEAGHNDTVAYNKYGDWLKLNQALIAKRLKQESLLFRYTMLREKLRSW